MDARDEYAAILPQLSGANRERAQLRILECGLAFGGTPAEISALAITDADVDAERSYALANYYRGLQQEPQMIAAVESAVSRAPSSHWTEAALFLAGNYDWVQNSRAIRLPATTRESKEKFPDSPDADSAHWRVTWTAVLERQAGDAQLLQEHLRRFPGSQYTPDALYWLGRLAEEAQTPALARSYYQKLAERYPHNYFQYLGSARLRALGWGLCKYPIFESPLCKCPIYWKPSRPSRLHPNWIAQSRPASQGSKPGRMRCVLSPLTPLPNSNWKLLMRATGSARLLLEAAQAADPAAQYGPLRPGRGMAH